MKRTIAILTLVVFTAVTLASCAAGARSSRSGCHVNQGYVGYGGR